MALAVKYLFRVVATEELTHLNPVFVGKMHHRRDVINVIEAMNNTILAKYTINQ